MAFINRSDATSLIPETTSREIVQGVVERSIVMQLGTRLPDMTSAVHRIPILSQLPQAYFVDGDTGLKGTTKMAWADKSIQAEEIAVIVPIPEAVLADSSYDIWGQIRPRVEEAFAQKFDAAVLVGDDAPSAWPDDIVSGATAASHLVTEGTGTDLYDDILGEGGVVSLVEEDGFFVNGHIAKLAMRAKLRGLREQVWDGTTSVAAGAPLFQRSPDRRDVQGSTLYELDGSPIYWDRIGAFDADTLVISGDFSQLVYAVRQEITYKILDQAVLTDSDGAVIYNLAQQDMVALRAVMRLGWQLPNPVNRVNDDKDTRYPFAVLEAA